MWKEPIFTHLISPDTLVSLAGDAFSAYALCPLLIAVLGSMGRMPVADSEPIIGQGSDGDESALAISSGDDG